MGVRLCRAPGNLWPEKYNMLLAQHCQSHWDWHSWNKASAAATTTAGCVSDVHHVVQRLFCVGVLAKSGVVDGCVCCLLSAVGLQLDQLLRLAVEGGACVDRLRH